MSKITLEYLRDLMNEWNRDEISLSRFAELLNERAKKVVLGDDYFQKVAESIEQSSEPEQQPNISKQDQNLEISSESEREKIALTEQIENMIEKTIETGEFVSNKTIKALTDFILEREKEKDAEIERLNQEIESLTVTVKTLNKVLTSWHGKAKELEAENERLKGEREKDAIGFAEWIIEQAIYYHKGWWYANKCLDTDNLYTEYLKSKTSNGLQVGAVCITNEKLNKKT